MKPILTALFTFQEARDYVLNDPWAFGEKLLWILLLFVVMERIVSIFLNPPKSNTGLDDSKPMYLEKDILGMSKLSSERSGNSDINDIPGYKNYTVFTLLIVIVLVLILFSTPIL